VVPVGHEAAETTRAVEELAAGAPLAQREIKRLVREVPNMDQEAAYQRMVALSRRLFSSPEGQEGMRAFREHRAPVWPSDGE
jgi:enoyl-CoA hydratase/carnithine racemase